MAGARDIRLGIKDFEELTRQINIEIRKVGSYEVVNIMPAKFEKGEVFYFGQPFLDEVTQDKPIIDEGLWLFKGSDVDGNYLGWVLLG